MGHWVSTLIPLLQVGTYVGTYIANLKSVQPMSTCLLRTTYSYVLNKSRLVSVNQPHLLIYS